MLDAAVVPFGDKVAALYVLYEWQSGGWQRIRVLPLWLPNAGAFFPDACAEPGSDLVPNPLARDWSETAPPYLWAELYVYTLKGWELLKGGANGVWTYRRYNTCA